MTCRRGDRPDTGPEVAVSLLRAQKPGLADLRIHSLDNTGSDNTLHRIGSEFVLRLPRFADAAARLDVELEWLPRLAELPVAVPELVHVGEPTDSYPNRWAVTRWLVGQDGWAARQHENWFGPDLGRDLAAVVSRLRAMPVAGAPQRRPGERGGSLAALDARPRSWLQNADGLLDEQVADGRLTAVLDWGTLGAADPALDLIPAWSTLDRSGAAAFRRELDVDTSSWLRGQGFALEQAVGGIVTYVPRGHPLGAVMQRTLDRLLMRG